MVPNENDSIDLLRRASEGDRTAFSELLVRHRERLLSRIRMMLGAGARKAAESGDFLQEVMVDALQEFDRGRLRSDRELLGFLTTVARNNIRDRVKKHRADAFSSLSRSLTGEASSRGSDGPSKAAIRNEHASVLLEALEDLTPDHREVIQLRSLDGLGPAETAERLGRSVDATRMLHARAMMQLGKRVNALLGD